MRYVAVLLLAIAAPAVAGQRPEGHRPDFEAMRRREGDDLALVLGLSAAQTPALTAMLADSGPPGPPMARPDTKPGFEQHLADRERQMAARDAEERKHIAATRAFYTTLDARQRAVFEAVMRLRHGPGGPGHHGPGGPGGPGPDGQGPGGD